VNACTIVARNYLPAARLLARSFLAQHVGSSFSILLLDATEPETSDEGFEVLTPYNIGIERREVHRMAMIYDVKEFATAVKPWLLRTLSSSDVAVYFDPDIEIFAPLDDIADLAQEHSIVLTPHMLTPLPNDGLLPDDLMILQAGTYNLGFIAVGRGAADFLDWWSEKLSRDCLVAVERGQFVDQRWVDFVPVLFDHVVLRDPTCNVAYWNLHERSLRRAEGRYEVDGGPLRFFHFSGFDPRRGSQLSAHLGRWARTRLNEHPELAQLCGEYAGRLMDIGYREHKDLPYRFDSLEQGISVDSRMRRVYREALEERDRDGRAEPPDPFDPASAKKFLDWLNEPVARGGLSRYLFALYRDSPDLQSRFPFIRNLHRDSFLRWIALSGRHEENIPPELMPKVALSPSSKLASMVNRWGLSVELSLQSAAARYPVLQRGTPLYFALRRASVWLSRRSTLEPAPGPRDLRLEIEATPTAGINIVGYMRAELGIGEVARKLIAGIRRSGIPFATITYRNTVSRQEFPFEERDPRRVQYDTNLVCINADQLRAFARDAGQTFFSGRYTIGVWFWELETFPDEFRGAFEFVDEVWVASDFVKCAITSATDKPVKVVPLPLEAPAAEPLERSSLNLPDSFLFLFTFDFMSVVERKNPLGLVSAFKQAFSPGEGPGLVIKSINGDRNIAGLERLRFAAAEHPDIHVVDGYVAPETNYRLMASCDCYISLHRSEGLGLTMAEAMSYGRPVIATGYSGNLTFMDEENSYLVPYTLVSVGPGSDPYPATATWAEPELSRASELMRHVYENRAESAERGMRGLRDITKRHSLDHTAEFLSDRLDQIHGGGGARTDRPGLVPARVRSASHGR
jgi:glycosyltransferase involved in cell wall biosynthesis